MVPEGGLCTRSGSCVQAGERSRHRAALDYGLAGVSNNRWRRSGFASWVPRRSEDVTRDAVKLDSEEVQKLDVELEVLTDVATALKGTNDAGKHWEARWNP